MLDSSFVISASAFQVILIRSRTYPTQQTAPPSSWVEMRTTSCWRAMDFLTFCSQLTFLLWCWMPCVRLVALGRMLLRAWWLRPKLPAPATTSPSCWCSCASHGTSYSQRQRQGKCKGTPRKERQERYSRPLEGWWSLYHLTVSDIEASHSSVSYQGDLSVVLNISKTVFCLIWKTDHLFFSFFTALFSIIPFLHA